MLADTWSIWPTVASLALTLVAAVYAQLVVKLRQRLLAEVRLRRAQVRDSLSDLQSSVSDAVSSYEASTDSTDPAERERLARITESTNNAEKRLLDAVEAMEKAAAAKESWWAKHGATVLVAIVGLTGTVFVTVWTTTVAKEDPSPDCVTFAAMLSETKTAHPDADAGALFGNGGIEFGDLEERCGDPAQFFDGLGG